MDAQTTLNTRVVGSYNRFHLLQNAMLELCIQDHDGFGNELLSAIAYSRLVGFLTAEYGDIYEHTIATLRDALWSDLTLHLQTISDNEILRLFDSSLSTYLLAKLYGYFEDDPATVNHEVRNLMSPRSVLDALRKEDNSKFAVARLFFNLQYRRSAVVRELSADETRDMRKLGSIVLSAHDNTQQTQVRRDTDPNDENEESEDQFLARFDKRLDNTGANCFDPKQPKTKKMFPNNGIGVTSAQAICFECPIQDACLKYALDNHIDYGIWGGESERARKRARKENDQVLEASIDQLTPAI
jgi:hypothetical protein